MILKISKALSKKILYLSFLSFWIEWMIFDLAGLYIDCLELMEHIDGWTPRATKLYHSSIFWAQFSLNYDMVN